MGFPNIYISALSLEGRNSPVTRMSWGDFKMAPIKRERVIRYVKVKVRNNQCCFRKPEQEQRSGDCRLAVRVSGAFYILFLLWRRSTMLMCLVLVTETLLYCRPPLPRFTVARARPRSTSTSTSSWIRALIHRHNPCVLLSAAVFRLLIGNLNSRRTTND